jgi:hypothetical protein
MIRSEIRRVLMTHWDPIGVKDEPNAADEYDSYIGGIFDLLHRGASNAEISIHLRNIEVEQMGLCDLHGNPFAREGSWDEPVAELQRLRHLFDGK